MSLQFTSYTIPLFITAIITFILLIIGARRQHMPSARIFILFCTSVLVWSLGYALEFMAVDLEAKLFWARVQYLGLISPAAFLLFTQLYLGIEEHIQWQNFIALMILPLIANVAAWTNDQHRMLWTAWDIDKTGAFPGLQLEHGPIFYAIVAYSYLLLLSGVYYISIAFRSNNHVRRGQAGILLAAVAAPWLGNLLYILDLTPNGLDLTPINFGISSIFLAIGLLRYHFLDVAPIARNLVIEKLHDAMIVIDNQGRIVDINPTAARLLRCTSRLAVARPANELLKELSGVVEQLGTAESIDVTTRLTGDGADGQERIFNASISVLLDQKQQVQGRVVVLHDVTQQERSAEALRESETQLRVLVHQLQELDRLKTRFMRNINHELRTPLTNITLYIDLLRAGNSANFERYIKVLDKEAATLRRLIEQTLDLERMDHDSSATSIRLQKTDLNQLLESVATSAAKVANKSDISFQYHLSSVPIAVNADNEMLKTTISSLLTNAFTYTPRGGNVCLELAHNEEQALIRVKDNGIGITPVDKEHIFERFYRGEQAANGNIPGLGIGLSTAKEHVEQHGGSIQVESTIGSGSIFTVFLPLATTAMQA